MTGPVEERSDVIASLARAVFQLEQSMKGCLVPESGCNIAYAIRGARLAQEIAAVTGGLQDEEGTVRHSGEVAFGADEQIARTLLTVMKFDPAVRSAARIRYSKTIYRIISDLFMECVTACPADPSRDAGLLDFTIASCCSDGVPDIVAVVGDAPGNRAIWIFDEEPARLASNIIILSNRIE